MLRTVRTGEAKDKKCDIIAIRVDTKGENQYFLYSDIDLTLSGIRGIKSNGTPCNTLGKKEFWADDIAFPLLYEKYDVIEEMQFYVSDYKHGDIAFSGSDIFFVIEKDDEIMAVYPESNYGTHVIGVSAVENGGEIIGTIQDRDCINRRLSEYLPPDFMRNKNDTIWRAIEECEAE